MTQNLMKTGRFNVTLHNAGDDITVGITDRKLKREYTLRGSEAWAVACWVEDREERARHLAPELIPLWTDNYLQGVVFGHEPEGGF